MPTRETRPYRFPIKTPRPKTVSVSETPVYTYNHILACLDPPQSTEHCDWLYGIFGHETSCTRYWTCWNGTATEQFCIGGLLYNEETHACDWPQNVAGCQKHRNDPAISSSGCTNS